LFQGIIERCDCVANADRAALENFSAKTGAMHHRSFDADLGERLEIRAWLAETFTAKKNFANTKVSPDEMIERQNTLGKNPDQRKAWMDDFDGVTPTAVEEIVRVASPVIFMRRTATQDTTLGGHPIKQDDKLILYYWSANRDENVFDDPFRFDVRREPNPHVGFGGPGPHFCLGAHLARREITVMFRELLQRIPDIEVSGEPSRLLSGFINGIKHLPVTFTPGGSSHSN